MKIEQTIQVILVIVLTAACQPTNNITGQAITQENDSVKIGALLSLSGEAALYGQATLEGIEEAVREQNAKGGIQGRQIELVVETYDTLNTVEGIGGLHKLVETDHIQYIIGPTWDDPAITGAANELGVIMIATDNSDSAEKEINLPNIYSLEYPNSNMFSTLAQYSIKHGKTRIAIIYDQNSWAQNVAEEFAKQEGITVVYKTQVTIDNKDFSTEILKIKKEQPDAIFVAFANEMPKVPFFKQLREQGINVPVYGAPSTESQMLLDNVGAQMEEIAYYPFPKTNPQATAFMQSYEDTRGKAPSLPYITNGYDAANMVFEGLKNDVKNAREMKEYLDTTAFHTITYGDIRFNEKGFVESDQALFDIKTVKEGQFVVA